MKLLGIPSMIARSAICRSLLKQSAKIAGTIDIRHSMDIYDLKSLPICDPRLFGVCERIPLEVEAYRNTVKSCDAIIIAAHECPYG
jgi:NAD(P)H-dependent FMN reductase